MMLGQPNPVNPLAFARPKSMGAPPMAPAPMIVPGIAPVPGLYSVGEPGFSDFSAMPMEQMSDLMQGTVKCWFEDRGFGFITPDGGTDDVFVHKKVLQDGQSLLKDSQVFFDLIYDAEKKKFSATKCFGATIAPLESEDSAGGSGSSRKKVWGPFCLHDPWEDLYAASEAPHLRAHLDRVPGTEPPEFAAVSKPKAPPTKPPEPQQPAAVPEEPGDDPSLAAASEQNEAAQTSSPAKAAPKEESPSKPTSIYDFFEDEDDSMMI
eukprot:TRINITY_DN28785_c0_g1_i1.p1 TRINITY_DN28785_c0_g1~~TRINITY_DN28785_c0_g1_i1.p1  ORF type:complete len:264 (+),score=68.19 TRINITY_DN28785_c0_g1_i1:77-868(+)